MSAGCVIPRDGAQRDRYTENKTDDTAAMDQSQRGSIMGPTWKIVLTGLSGIVLGAAGMAALAAQTVAPPAYYVGNVHEVKDADAYKAYAGKVADTLMPFGGKFIVRGAEPVILDASRKPPGYIVII